MDAETEAQAIAAALAEIRAVFPQSSAALTDQELAAKIFLAMHRHQQADLRASHQTDALRHPLSIQ